MKKINYHLLLAECKRKGYTQKRVAEIIGMSEKNLSERKSTGKELTGSQVAMICSLIQSPLDMFVMEVE